MWVDGLIRFRDGCIRLYRHSEPAASTEYYYSGVCVCVCVCVVIDNMLTHQPALCQSGVQSIDHAMSLHQVLTGISYEACLQRHVVEPTLKHYSVDWYNRH